MSREKMMQETLPEVVDHSERFLRSINLLYDAESPENLTHFQPTQKTNRLFEAILGLSSDRASMVAAPYGSGKSLSAAVSLHLMENRRESRFFLHRLLQNGKALSDPVRQFAQDRLKSESRGLVLALHGYAPSCPEGIREAALDSLKRLGLEKERENLAQTRCESADDFPDLFDQLKHICARHGLDRVAIIWDEFGRHLESLVSEGRAENLLELQVLAEYCSRAKKIPFTLTILLHQILSRYAHRLPQTAQSEWAKIEGRFTSIQYVDTSKELYRLITEVQETLGQEEDEAYSLPSRDLLQRTAEAVLEEGLFKGFSEDELVNLLEKAHPIEPVALYLLPRVSARVAQNERTMFTFLYETDSSQRIGPEEIYDYFGDLMQADMSVGGTGKAWLEAQSAIQKCRDDEASVKALKTACLLGLGVGGERSQASLDLLHLALNGYATRDSKTRLNLSQLIEKKLLLHRRHTNSVSVWHGTDFDLRGRLEGLMDLRANSFEWIQFLREYCPPPAWKAVRYYTEYGVKRYCSATYASLDDLTANEVPLLSLRDGEKILDGRIIHILTKSREEVLLAMERAQDLLKDRSQRFLISVPSENVDIWTAALEVSCLQELLEDDQLISQDPMVPAELAELMNDAQDYLSRLVNRATQPKAEGPKWIHQGESRRIESPRKLRNLLTEIFVHEFSDTPRINNELIVKHRISKPIANARRKLMSGILNQKGDPMFGLPESEYRRPQASMCRTVLRKTGLYREDSGGTFAFCPPEQVTDPGLARVWSQLRSFYTSPDHKPKNFSKLIADLTQAPIGLRSGLIPLMLCAGYAAFFDEGMLFEEERYLEEIYSTTFEEIHSNPESYSLQVVDLNPVERDYLRRLIHLFSSDLDSGDEVSERLLPKAHTVLEQWADSLPAAALTTKFVSTEARKLQEVIRQDLDPKTKFISMLPEIFSDAGGNQATLEGLARCISELTSVTTKFQDQVIRRLQSHFTFRNGNGSNGGNLLTDAKQWSRLFPEAVRSQRSDIMGRRLLEITSGDYSCEGELLDEIAVLVVGRPIIHWDSATPERFRDRLEDMIGRLERHVLSLEKEEIRKDSELLGVKQIVEKRIHELQRKLSQFADLKKG